MATPMSMSGLPALTNPSNDALNITEPKKFGSDGNKAAPIGANTDHPAGEEQAQPGPKPLADHDSDQVRGNLGKLAIPSEKRPKLGFGLWGDEDDALYQYTTTTSNRRHNTGDDDDPARTECWGSPRRESELEESEHSAPVTSSSADLFQTLQKSSKPGGGDCTSDPTDEHEMDVASTESLYEGEGGAALGSVCVGTVDVGEGMGSLHTGRYDGGGETSLAKAMRTGPGVNLAEGLYNPISFSKENLEKELSYALIREENGGVSPSTCEEFQNASFSNLWEDECMKYLGCTPEFRAQLHYEVRVILISPAFHAAGCTVSAFEHLYQKKFGRTIDSVGFSTVARLCRSMPHVVQRELLVDEGKLQLVDTPKNHRIIAGIRSGLRRIVYDIIKYYQGVEIETIEVLLEKVIGKPLNEVLIDHGYQTLSIECLLRDIQDIIYLDEQPKCTKVYLCNGAKDPALTDGLLIKRPILEESLEILSKDENKFNASGGMYYSKSLKALKCQSLNDDVSEQMIESPQGPRCGSNGMAPEELSNLQVLCAAESISPYGNTSISAIEDLSPHVRLRFRLLLVLHNDGHGIIIGDLPSIYEKMFSTPLDLVALGFDSIQELIDAWKDVVLVKGSNDGWIFPINSLENYRILKTITSGLRSSVFAILLARYPKGMEPLKFVECLEETLSTKFWEILTSNGYIFKNLSKTQEVLSKGPLDFQLAECFELRLLLKDMEDFVRLGCLEDGNLVIKLQDGEFPLLDLLDCEVFKEPTSNKDEPFCGLGNRDALTTKLTTDCKYLILDQAIEVSGNFMMDVHTQHPTTTKGKNLTANDEVMDGNYKREGLTFEENFFASPSTSPLFVSNAHTHSSKQVCFPLQKLMHEIRMILGSLEHMENSLTIEEFCIVYKKRTGHSLCLGEFKSMESLLKTMPNVVSFELNCVTNKQVITLVKSYQNIRILSIAKSGLRQVLFWILLKNPGGIWKELLEGWYLDFAGCPLSSALTSRGYDKPHHAPLQPITLFLQDMADLITIDETDSNLYLWIGSYEDPIIADALLLGIPMETIQYDISNEENENLRWHTSINAKSTTQFKSEEDEKTYNTDKTLSIGSSIEVH